MTDLAHPNPALCRLEHLKRLTKLQSLYLQNTKVTDAGVKKLQQALPQCKVHSDFVVVEQSGPAAGWAAEATPEQAKAIAEIEMLGGKVTVEKVRTSQ